MRVLIYGCGAVGGVFAAALAQAGHEVALVGRPAHVAAIRSSGLRLEGMTRGTWRVPITERLDRPLEVDLLLLTVKSFDLRASTEAIGRVLDRPTPILLPQNGLGIEEHVRAALASVTSIRPPLVRAVTTIPAQLVRPGLVRHNGTGELRLAEPTRAPAIAPAIRAFHDLLVGAGLSVRYVEDLELALWSKAVLNGAINPVTAAFGVTNGALQDAPYRDPAEALLGEGLLAANASGHALSASELEAELWRTVRATAENRSSMLQDVERGRPTEIAAISGELLAAGRAHGIRMPRTEEFIDKVEARARSRGQSS
ncbi:MAG: ketopantoate reductase family protein [Thermoplasmata archaeon]